MKPQSQSEARTRTEEEAEEISRKENVSAFRGKKLVDRMRGRGTSWMSTEEILTLTRGEN